MVLPTLMILGFTYSPSPNYFGEDDFVITFSATQIDENQQPVGGPILYKKC